MRPDPDKTRAVLEMKEPSTINEVRSFLCMVNQLGKFIPCLAEKDRPPRDLTFWQKETTGAGVKPSKWPSVNLNGSSHPPLY